MDKTLKTPTSLGFNASYRVRVLKELANNAVSASGANSDLEVFSKALNNDEDSLSAVLDRDQFPIDRFTKLAGDCSSAKYNNQLRWDLTPEDLDSLTDEIIYAYQQVDDQIAAIPAGQHTFENTILPFHNIDQRLAALESSMSFPMHVSTDRKIRDASAAGDKKLQQFAVESNMRIDVYNAVQAYSKTTEATELSGEEKRLLEHRLRDFRRNGLHLDDEKREKVKELQKRMSELSIEFSKNLAEEDTKLEFTEAELDGMTSDQLSKFEKTDDGKYIVTLKYPDYVPTMKFCAVEETRKTLEKAYNRRCIDENTPLIEEMIQLRAQKAKILGYKTHADFVLEVRMAKKAEAVQKFLSELSEKLNNLLKNEVDYLLQLKQAEKAERKEEFDGKIHLWDSNYYQRICEEKKYQVDHLKLKEYFPLNVVCKGLLDIYQQILGLKFQEVENPHVWHPDVQLFNVSDSKCEKLIGQFYLDLHPRPGKYGHAACFGLAKGCEVFTSDDSKNSRQYPVAGCVCNFSKPTAEKPSLLTHNEVTTFFHEFGHVMHQICTETKYIRFAGTATERDFVEAPSQMLENWTWEKESLLLMSEHYESKEPIPDELIEKLVASNKANAGLFNKRQLVFGLFDQLIHASDSADTAAVFAQVQNQVFNGLVDATPDTNMAASFGHLMGGYDATYYGYMWSEVFSMDMFMSIFKKNGLLDAESGAHYRKEILSKGGSLDGDELLRNFLGRDPIMEPFLVSKGLGSSQA